MGDAADTDIQLQHWLERLHADDVDAREALINYSCERLRRLTHKLLRDYPLVQRWEQTDDVLQRSVLRLYRALADEHPTNVRGFMGLAATQIRRELIDLARHYGGPQGLGARHATNSVPGRNGTDAPPRYEKADSTAGPATLQLWTEFHQQVAKLPEAEREVFDLIFYQEVPQSEVARLLEVDVRTVKRRWRSARLRLCEALGDALPIER